MTPSTQTFTVRARTPPRGAPDVPNASDSIYQQSQGMTLLNVQPDGDGYAATFEIAIQTT